MSPVPIREYQGARPRLAPGVWVAPDATLIGDLEIGPDSSVFYGCVIRADVHLIRIGARTNVQDLSILHVTRDRHPTRVGDEVTIGHRAVVHGCTVGDGALIGIGAVVLDGAVIGDGALVGAGALVTPGCEVPPRTLVVGTPAREVRMLSDAEREEQRERTLHYVSVARAHAAADASAAAERSSQ